MSWNLSWTKKQMKSSMDDKQKSLSLENKINYDGYICEKCQKPTDNGFTCENCEDLEFMDEN